MARLLPETDWQDIIEHVRQNNADVMRGWFVKLRPTSLDAGTLTVEAENLAQARYLDESARRVFTEAVQVVMGRLLAVDFVARMNIREPDPLSFESDDSLDRLSKDHVFEQFVVGPCNRLAHAAAVAAAANPGKAYNPLFIHGNVGLGKTHLLQAICLEIRRNDPKAKILYLSCETFVNHFLEAVEHGAPHQFRQRYRQADVLVIEDIQFLAERERSQEEFFHTFNALHQLQRQIVLTADCSPSNIPSLEHRLVSRFNSGLVAMVDRPCFETRMAIIRAKMRLRCIELPDDVVRLLASRIDSNVRELEGKLARLDLLSHTNGGMIDLELALEAVGGKAEKRSVGIPHILDVVARRYNLRVSDIQGKRRTKSVVFPRQVCMYLAREMTSMSLEEIGGYFGGRDHTTVIHSHRQISQKRRAEQGVDDELRNLEGVLLTVP